MQITSINPATAEVIGEVTAAGEAEVRDAVARARAALPGWSRLSFRERGGFILRVRESIRTHLDEIALLITRENGKPLAEAVSADLFPVMDLATYFAKNAGKILKREKIWLGKWAFMGRSSTLEYHPLGVVGIIGPWNFPFSIPCGQTIMALMAGNTVVLKPSELTPLVGLKIEELFREAGLPAGVLHVIPGDGATGAALVGAGVNKILFTGSTPTGKKIMELAAKTLTPVELEMGGKDPMIVLEDADLEVASSAAVWGAFSNAGQVCSSVERLYVHEKIAGPFLEKCVEKTRRLRQGDPQQEVDLGPLSSEVQRAKVEKQVREAVAQGAEVLTGAERVDGGYFYRPTILTGVNHRMEVMSEETFGPVVGVMSFKDDEEAIRLANDSRFGLTASVWTRNLNRGMKIARRLEVGTVTVNENLYTYALAETPWGGPKESSIGRTHGRLGLLELVEPKHIHVNRIARIKDFWWYSYDQAKYRLLVALGDTLFGKGIAAKIKGAIRFLWYQLKIKNL